MIILEKLHVQAGSKMFSVKTKRFLRIQTSNSVVHTLKPAKVVSESAFHWEQQIQIPLVYDLPMDFQIYQKHQFGYNPEQISKILHGKIIFTKGNDKYYNWQIYDCNQKKVAYLTVNLKSKVSGSISPQKKNNNNTNSVAFAKVPQTQMIIVSSIIVNLPLIKLKRAYAVVSTDKAKVKTSVVKSKLGQLVFVERYQLQISAQNLGKIQIFTFDSEGKQQFIGQAQIKFKEEKKIDKKLRFVDQSGADIGEGFIDAKIENKNDVFAQKIMTNMIRRSFQQEKQSGQKQKTLDASMIKLNYSNSILNKSRSRTVKNDNYSVDFSRSQSKMKNSIVNANTNIKIPQQKRFKNYRDPPNPKISYLPEQSFEFLQKRVGKYYRGASIGYGQKNHFNNLDNPGVGKYHLPSIWDRY